MPPIHHYYHIYADGAWHDAVREHLAALKCSGLATNPAFSLCVGIVGTAENAAALRLFLDGEIRWYEIGRWDRGWEQLTLAALARDSHSHEGFAFYAHTKGAHEPGGFNVEWRRRMTHFTVTKWRDAVEALKSHTAYGCHWMQLEGNWLFGGNFWWTQMSALRLLPPPKMDTRWQAEEWIGQLPLYAPDFRVIDPAPRFSGTIRAA